MDDDRRQTGPADTDDDDAEDEGRFFRGAVIAGIVSAPAWVALGLLVWWLFR